MTVNVTLMATLVITNVHEPFKFKACLYGHEHQFGSFQIPDVPCSQSVLPLQITIVKHWQYVLVPLIILVP